MKNLGAWALLVSLIWAGFQADAQTQIVNAGTPQGQAPASEEFKDFDDSLIMPVQKTAIVPRTPLIRIEPVFGLTASTVEGASHVGGASIEPLKGYQGGMGAVFGRSALKFETGLLYAERGMQYVSAFDTSAKYTVRSRYLEIPVLLHYSFQDRASSNFFLKTGVVVGMLQEARGTYEGNRAAFFTSPTDSAKNDTDLKNNLASQDYRAQIGLGIIFRINKGASWVIQGDYQRSINNIAKSSFTSDTLYNTSIGFTTGISLDL